MISYQEAQQSIQQMVTPLEVEIIPLEKGLNRVLVNSVTSNLNLPSFSNSAMDGYVFNASDINKKTLKCVGSIAAGDTASSTSLTEDTCIEIMTGAPIPLRGDTVIPVENTSIDEHGVMHINRSVLAKANVRLAGEDIEKGAELMRAGTWITAQHISLLAAVGVAEVTVQKRLQVVVLTTGNEVVADLNKPLNQGQIYNSSLYYLKAVLPQLGVDIIHTAVLQDDPTMAKQEILNALEKKPDVIITTGAVSMGKYDFIPPLIEKLKGDILFHKVALRPGMPLLVGQVPCCSEGAKKTWWLGLPGNPVATMVGLRFLGSTVLRGLLGLPTEKPARATLTSDARSKMGFRHFQKARFFMKDGNFSVDVLKGQASFMLSPLLKSNAWAVLDEETTQLTVGEKVDIYPLLWPEVQPFLQQEESKNAIKN